MKKADSLALFLTSSSLVASSAFADLIIYEPFDYEPTVEVNENGFFGDGNQAGGAGLGEWSQVDNNGNSTPASPPVNEGDVADEGVTFTDSEGNELPVAGNAYERRQRVGQVAVSSPIDEAATLALTGDNQSMWMTFLFQDFGFSGPDFGIGLHSEKMVGNDNQDLVAPGFGVGYSINSTGGQARNIGTALYDNSVNFTRETEPTPTFNGPADSEVFLLAMKVNWNPSGTPDEIFVFIIDDLTTEPDEADALASDTFDWDLETQQSLTWLNFSDTQVGYVDEIRVGTTFADVVAGTAVAAPQELKLAITPDPATPGTFDFSWASREGKVYDLVSSPDLSTAPSTWEVFGDNSDIPGEDGTTSLDGVSVEGDARRFFAIIEKNAPVGP